VAGVPHHVTQRGNRRQPVFFRESDYGRYLRLMAEWCGRSGVEVWAYCLMPNHVHLVAVPHRRGGLALAIGEAHRRYTLAVNRRERWTGYLWQGRFASNPLDGRYLLAAARYIEQNPVRAGLVREPGDYEYSSARAHLRGRDDLLVKARPLLGLVGDWRGFLAAVADDSDTQLLRLHSRTGRPLGDERFIRMVERKLHRKLAPQKRGPKRS
jgi:putative transposase